MKKLLSAMLCMLLVVSLCACSSKDDANTISVAGKDGTVYVIDSENGTISDGTYTYQYKISGSSSGYTIDITYPDGSTYWWRTQKSGSFSTGSGGWSDDYDENRYVDGDTLCDVLEADVPEEKESKSVLLIFLFLIVGVFNAAFPYAAWYLEYGWRYKNAEPSDMALGLSRLGGIVAIIIAVIMIFV